jgi:hypothetical protein
MTRRRFRARHIGASILAAFLVGAGVAYLADPRNGRRRRAYLRDRLIAGSKRLRRELVRESHRAENRGRGVFAQLGSILRGGQPIDDVLIARVRAKLGHICEHPQAHAIEVHVKEDGLVELFGPVRADLHDVLVREIGLVPGVRKIDDRMWIASTIYA